MKDVLERYRGVAFAVFTLAALTLGFFIVLPFIPAILWATVLSILMMPLYRSMAERLDTVKSLREKGLAESLASLIVTLITLVLVCVPFLLIGLGLYGQIADLTKSMETGVDGHKQPITLQSIALQIDATIKPLADRMGFQDFSATDYVRENAREIVQNLRQPVGKAARSVGYGALTLVVALLTMFFAMRDGHRLKQPAIELLPLEPDRSEALFKRIAETVRAVFIGTVLVAILQGTIMGITFAIVGVKHALLMGVISVVLCIVPLLGAPVLYIPIGLMLLFTGQVWQGVVVLGVGMGIVSLVDNALKPFFIGGRVNLHPMAIFFSILGGVLLFGPIGVMAGPVVLTVLLTLQDVVRERQRSAPAVEHRLGG